MGSAAIAVAPNGSIGLTWRRDLALNGAANSNVFFAILNPAGDLVFGPANVTNFSALDTGGTPGVPMVCVTSLAATDDNRFVLAWQQRTLVAGCSGMDCHLGDIYYSVRDTAGGVVKAVTRLTNDYVDAQEHDYAAPAVLALDQGRALLTFNGDAASTPAPFGSVILTSAGGIVSSAVVSPCDLSAFPAPTPTAQDFEPEDLVRLPDGRVLAAGQYTPGGRSLPFFGRVLISSSGGSAGACQTFGSAPAQWGSVAAAAVSDGVGRTVLTWAGQHNWRHLYYAMVGSGGTLATPPMIFRTDPSPVPLLESVGAYGASTYSTVAAGAVDMVVSGGQVQSGRPNGTVALRLSYTNHGQTTATGVGLSAELGRLAYRGQTSGITPILTSNPFLVALPNTPFADRHTFTLYVGVPPTATLGTNYPVTLTVYTSGSDVVPLNNTAVVTVTAAFPVFLPMIGRR